MPTRLRIRLPWPKNAAPGSAVAFPATGPGGGTASPAATRPWRRPPRQRRWVTSPLTQRILMVNVMALALLAFSLFYLDQYRGNLIATQLGALRIQADISAAALAEGAVEVDKQTEIRRLIPDRAGPMLRRLVEPTRARARLFGTDGALQADTQLLAAPEGGVQVRDLPPPPPGGAVSRLVFDWFDYLVNRLPLEPRLPPYAERKNQTAADYIEAERALAGTPTGTLRRTGSGDLLLSVAVPVQNYKQILGALMLSMPGDAVAATLREVRLNILKLFVGTVTVTILLSLYLAQGIVNPIRRLAAAAEGVRLGGGGLGGGRGERIPDLTGRKDEIGDLSGALREMTEALWRRMDAIERFAADVSHEIKNPLTSLKSAVETASRLDDPVRLKRLLQIIEDDVGRLDRLITDISDASRLDAELSRTETELVDLKRLIGSMVAVFQTTRAADGPLMTFEAPDGPVEVAGLESRLGQVLGNLIGNAVSFSPPGGRIRLSLRPRGEWVEIRVEDEGPGIPESKLEAVFERFYSERPSGEKFGTHSGLGLAISRQIVEAHGGRIWAENRAGPQGAAQGARFVVRLRRP